jgi:nitroimidazol reductase NimA-like FMN-containing flavoprotein (pyridoxamine 5'-phosphate oxidase superfamily)
VDEACRNRLAGALVEGAAAAPAKRVLAEAPVAYLALSSPGWPYVVPLSFAYDGSAIHFHGRGTLKAELLAADPRVCLAVSTLPGFVVAGDPCDDNFRYESVLAFGTVVLAEEDEARECSLRAIVAKYHPELRSAPFKPNTFARTLVYAMTVEALTYKQNPEA